MSLTSPAPLPRTLLEALGVEATGPVSGSLEHPGGGYDVLVAKDPDALLQAREAANWLLPVFWGASLAPPSLRRARFLVDLSTKFEDFVFDPRLRLLFGQKRSTFDIQSLMNNGKILLVNVAKGKLTEANSRFLGMVLMAMIQSAAMSRVHLPVEKRRPFYLYVDEFQSVATENFVLMLSEARKFGLGLVLANQFLSQIKDPRITEAIFGNVGTLVSFRVSNADAELLEAQFAPYFDRYDLTNLSNWTACVKTQVSGQVVAPFSLRTRAPDVAPDAAVADQVRAAAQVKSGRPRSEVEAEIEASLSGRKARKVPEGQPHGLDHAQLERLLGATLPSDDGGRGEGP